MVPGLQCASLKEVIILVGLARQWMVQKPTANLVSGNKGNAPLLTCMLARPHSSCTDCAHMFSTMSASAFLPPFINVTLGPALMNGGRTEAVGHRSQDRSHAIPDFYNFYSLMKVNTEGKNKHKKSTWGAKGMWGCNDMLGELLLFWYQSFSQHCGASPLPCLV